MEHEIHEYSFEKLDVWKLARNFKKEIYLISQNFPKNEQFGLTSQIRRSSSRITASLAEGSGRSTTKDKARFTNYAYTSALETFDHLICAYDLGYIPQKNYISLRISLDEITNKLNSLYQYQLNFEKDLKSKL